MPAEQNGAGKKWQLIKSHIGRRALNNRDKTEKRTKREREEGREQRIINSKMPSGHSIKPNEKLKDSCACLFPSWI